MNFLLENGFLNQLRLSEKNDPSTVQEFECPVCKEKMCWPMKMILPCQHNLCGLCINSLEKTKCPLCRISFHITQGVSENLLLKKLAHNLEMHCIAHACGWKGKVEEFPHHLESGSCQFIRKCPDCLQYICGEILWMEHLKTCEKKKTECSRCGISLLQKDLSNHLEKECLSLKVECGAKIFGCSWVGSLKEYHHQHYEKCRIYELYQYAQLHEKTIKSIQHRSSNAFPSPNPSVSTSIDLTFVPPEPIFRFVYPSQISLSNNNNNNNNSNNNNNNQQNEEYMGTLGLVEKIPNRGIRLSNKILPEIPRFVVVQNKKRDSESIENEVFRKYAKSDGFLISGITDRDRQRRAIIQQFCFTNFVLSLENSVQFGDEKTFGISMSHLITSDCKEFPLDEKKCFIQICLDPLVMIITMADKHLRFFLIPSKETQILTQKLKGNHVKIDLKSENRTQAVPSVLILASRKWVQFSSGKECEYTIIPSDQQFIRFEITFRKKAAPHFANFLEKLSLFSQTSVTQSSNSNEIQDRHS